MVHPVVIALFLLPGQISLPAFAGSDPVCEYFKVIAPSEFQPDKKPLNPKILAQADQHSFEFKHSVATQKFESGDPVSLSWVSPGALLANAKAGIFVGTAQRLGNPHMDSQLLLRMVWRLREVMGRDTLDPLVLSAFVEMPLLNMSAKDRAAGAIAVDTRNTYLFAVALKEALEKAGKQEEAQKWLDILEEADMPPDVVERIQDKGYPFSRHALRKKRNPS